MRRTISETNRRRALQLEYNRKHRITPSSIRKEVREGIEAIKKAREIVREVSGLPDDLQDAFQVVSDLEKEMEEAARGLQFERAIALRDQIRAIQKKLEKERPARTHETQPRSRSLKRA
jgi:excinuclease ABC subunit B